MFVHMSIHRVKPECEAQMADSMRRFGAAMKGKSGLREVQVLKQPVTGELIGLAIWDDRESWHAAREDMLAAIQDDPFEEWELESPQVFQLHPHDPSI